MNGPKSGYAFVSRWTVDCPREELWSILAGLLESPDPFAWWPAVHVTAYDGERLAVCADSRLGYRLRFTLYDLTEDPPWRLGFRSTGDLTGRGVVTFGDAGGGTTILAIDWRVEARPAWMRRARPLLSPVFTLGHHLVMRQGERRLNAWLRSRPAPG